MTKHHDPKELREHKEIMTGAQQEVDSHLHSHWEQHKHWYTPVISLFLVGLMLSFTLSAFPVGDILASLAASSVLDFDDSLEFDLGEVVLSSEVALYLSELYVGEEGAEISVCLEGTISSDGNKLGYKIDSYYIPQIFYRSFSHVRFESCSEETIISLHTHPRGSCIASETDLNTLQGWQKGGRPEMVMLIQCGNRRFRVES